MDANKYELHIQAGKICGEEKTCGKKNAFNNEEAAQKASNHHNKWEGRNHDVEPYPCAFCNKWHIGNIMSEQVLLDIIKGE